MCGMKRVLITGMSGTGKSVPQGELTGLGSGGDWVRREDRIAALLAPQDADTLFVSGTSPNQGKFYAQSDHVVLLTAPPDVIAERLASRTNNSFGKDPTSSQEPCGCNRRSSRCCAAARTWKWTPPRRWTR